jgi:hypothetical protein
MAKGVKSQEEERAEEDQEKEMKRKKVEEAKVKVIEGRTEKHFECMEEKVLEKIHKIETTRVQPIIHRDRYQVEVHQIVQPIIEKVTKATVLEIKPPISEELGTRVVEATFEAAQPAVVGTTVISPAQPLPVPAESRSEVVSVVQRHEELPPIVEETVHRKIVERITPLILKEIVMPNMALVEAFPEGVVTSDGTTIHTQVGAPVVIERLVIRAATESMEERLQRLEAKAQRKAQKRAAKELLKAERRASKLELKAQKRAAKAERKALKRVLREQELVVEAELAVKAMHERERQRQQQQVVEGVAVKETTTVPAVVVMDIDEAAKEKGKGGVEVVTTVDEAVVKKVEKMEGPSTAVVANLTDKSVVSTKLKNFSPLIVTRSGSQQELEPGTQPQQQPQLTKNQKKKKQQQQQQQKKKAEAAAGVETPEQVV